MHTIVMRLRIAGQLAWCALVHGMERSRGGWRCLKCEPIRKQQRIHHPLLDEPKREGDFTDAAQGGNL